MSGPDVARAGTRWRDAGPALAPPDPAAAPSGPRAGAAAGFGSWSPQGAPPASGPEVLPWPTAGAPEVLGSTWAPRPGAPGPVVLLPARRRRPLAAVGAVAAVVTAGLVSGAAWWVGEESARLAPPRGLEEAGAPLGAPPPESALDEGPHTFSAMQPDGSGPVTYSPCRPIHYVVRPDGAPPQADLLVRTAVERVSAATGLQFVADGATDEGPDPDRAAYQPDRYGRRWAPVLFTWSDEVETPGLAGDVAGTGGSASVTVDGRAVYVTGEVTLDTAELAPLVESPNGTAVAIGVVTHELAHVVGLGHVDDPTQLMYPSTNLAVTAFSAGDRAGLAALGRGACAPDV